MANCRQACPYNTLDGCKVKEYNAICPLTNMATPITEYRMTNADRIRAMNDEELAWELMTWRIETEAKHQGVESNYPNTQATILEWLKQPADGQSVPNDKINAF